jgi:hypothetical protein
MVTSIKVLVFGLRQAEYLVVGGLVVDALAMTTPLQATATALTSTATLFHRFTLAFLFLLDVSSLSIFKRNTGLIVGNTWCHLNLPGHRRLKVTDK